MSIRELAKQLNLSAGTVSRILNDKDAPYAAETRRRVMERAAHLGYQPNPVARALAVGRTHTVALWAPDLQGTYQAWVLSCLSRQNTSQDYHLLIRLFNQRPAGQDLPRHPLLSDSVDGIITHGLPPAEWLSRAHRGAQRTPVVITGDASHPDVPDFVGISFADAAHAAVSHLLGQGLRRIALLSPPYTRDPRYLAYEKAMKEAHLPLEFLSTPYESRAEIRRAVRDYVAAHGHPEGMVCHNDATAIAAYRALCDLGLRVPEDVALVGCDGTEEVEYLPTPITTIVQPVEQMSRLAWEFLLRRIQEPEAPPQRTVLQARLEIRASSLKD